MKQKTEKSSKVVRKGEILEIAIFSKGRKKDGSEGDGVVKMEGLIKFVPHSEVGRN